MWLEKRQARRSTRSALRRRLPYLVVCGAVYFALVSPAWTGTGTWNVAPRSSATFVSGRGPTVRAQGPYVIFVTPGPSNRDFNLSFMNPGPGTVNELTIQWVGGVISSFAVDGVPASTCKATGVEDAFGCYPLSDGPGQTLIGHGTTRDPIPEDAPFILYSTTDSFSTATRHDVKFQTPPAPAKCKCAGLSAYMNNVKTSDKAGGTQLSMDVHWVLTCTSGAGPGCKGIVEVTPPVKARFVKQDAQTAPLNAPGIPANIACGGPCGANGQAHSSTGKSKLTWVATEKAPPFRPDPRYTKRGRRNRTFPIKVQTRCLPPATRLRGAFVTLKLHFDANGNVDYKKSDLNGDGRPDRKEL